VRYKVTKQYGRGAETPCAEFEDLNDARLFAENKLQNDAGLALKVVYRISQLGEVIETFDPTLVPASEAGSAGGKSSAAGFRPTPLNMAPKPTGMPQKWRFDPDEDEKKK